MTVHSANRQPRAHRPLSRFGLLAWSLAILGSPVRAAEGDEDRVRQALELLRQHQAGEARAQAAKAAPTRDARTSYAGVVSREDAVRPAVSSSAAPLLGPAALSLDGDIHLAEASAVFKGGQLFLWQDIGVSNLGLGHRALVNTTSGTSNTAVGTRSMVYNTGGTRNTAVGYSALRNNVDGSSNTALGAGALRFNTSGSHNTALGESALYANETGSRNTAVHGRALISNTTGSNNTAVGSRALYPSNGDANTAIGYRVLDDNTSGAENVAFGFRALYANEDGNRSIAIGERALYSHTGGGSPRNTAVGRDALDQLASGQVNVALGDRAGDLLTSGTGNIFLGSGVNGSATESNTIRIGGGTGTSANQQNRIFIAGIRGTTTDEMDAIAVLIDSAGQLGTMSSSRTLKQDIRPIGRLGDRLTDLEPVAFRYRQHAATDPDTPVQFGLIAEDVAKIFPELVVFDTGGRPETIKYQLLEPLLVDRLQHVLADLDSQRRTLARQRTALSEIQRGGETVRPTDGASECAGPKGDQ